MTPLARKVAPSKAASFHAAPPEDSEESAELAANAQATHRAFAASAASVSRLDVTAASQQSAANPADGTTEPGSQGRR